MSEKTADERYNLLFRNSGIAILEEDFSEVFSAIDKIAGGDLTLLAAYLDSHSDEIYRIFSRVKMIDVNPAALRLFEADSKEHFLGSLRRILDHDAIPFLREELLAFARRERFFEGETVNRTLSGRSINLLISISFFGESGENNRAIVSMVDISDRKRREREAEERRLLSETIQDITMVITGEFDRDRLLDLILEQLRRVVSFTSGSIKLFSDGTLKVARSLGHKERGVLDFILNLEMLPKSFPLVREVMEKREPVIVPDVHNHEGWTVYPETSYIRSIIFIPLIENDVVIGEIALESDIPDAYSFEDGEKLKPFASAVSLALKNSALYKQLLDSIRQREVLLRELHHRVKNNLALVNSLVSLQYQQVDDPATGEILSQIQRKISSILLVHEKLYSGSDLEYIVLREYVRDLLQDLTETEEGERRIEIRDDIDASISYSIGILIPLGLIISELYTNSLKYARVPEGEPLVFSIRAAVEGEEVRFFIGDNGQGLPEGTVFADPVHHAGGIGLTLVESLAKQVDGSAGIRTGPGGGVLLNIPLEKRNGG
jgi:two-component sensor histidine kinase